MYVYPLFHQGHLYCIILHPRCLVVIERQMICISDENTSRPVSPIETLDQQIDTLDSHISRLYQELCWDTISLHGLGNTALTPPRCGLWWNYRPMTLLT